jgi:RHS repeat-associated protein
MPRRGPLGALACGPDRAGTVRCAPGHRDDQETRANRPHPDVVHFAYRLNYHGVRHYAPWLGRWTAADPAGFIDGPNLYAYATLNPVGNSDPTGYATRQQFQHVIATALEKAQAGNRTL